MKIDVTIRARVTVEVEAVIIYENGKSALLDITALSEKEVLGRLQTGRFQIRAIDIGEAMKTPDNVLYLEPGGFVLTPVEGAEGGDGA